MVGCGLKIGWGRWVRWSDSLIRRASRGPEGPSRGGTTGFHGCSVSHGCVFAVVCLCRCLSLCAVGRDVALSLPSVFVANRTFSQNHFVFWSGFPRWRRWEMIDHRSSLIGHRSSVIGHRLRLKRFMALANPSSNQQTICRSARSRTSGKTTISWAENSPNT